MEEALRTFFAQHAQVPSQVDWRMHCYREGQSYARAIERDYFSLRGKRVLDMSCAWGGHAIAFAEFGAHVTAADLSEHKFDALRGFAADQALSMRVLQAECQRAAAGGQAST